MQIIHVCAVAAAGAAMLYGQAKSAKAPFQSRSASTISYSVKDGEEAVDITNVSYELADDHAPGRPADARLVVRTTTKSREVIGDEGVEATVTIDAWPFGLALESKPRYTLKVEGVSARVVENEVWLVDRATDPDSSWWSVYNVGTGQHLFDTYTDLLKFSTSRETVKMRYAGLEPPADDTTDARLKEPHVVSVVTFASAEKVIREALITCDNREKAQVYRSFADGTRAVSLAERAAGQALRVAFSNNYPSAANAVVVSIPIARDDLDLAHAELPAGWHVAAFRR